MPLGAVRMMAAAPMKPLRTAKVTTSPVEARSGALTLAGSWKLRHWKLRHWKLRHWKLRTVRRSRLGWAQGQGPSAGTNSAGSEARPVRSALSVEPLRSSVTVHPSPCRVSRAAKGNAMEGREEPSCSETRLTVAFSKRAHLT